ncbi:hypothetical protein CYMTET_41761 [Cymbomonas tetramitiformis]|uniref:Uncharacterized protein n=1 Tax=Cymbomonas tetramitiformis TaxID=36881 RepID=A0AAE0F270_9CHLO|nr:hypothetical protein CYMTET_41761 [Cymbomonas tetramitiformis]
MLELRGQLEQEPGSSPSGEELQKARGKALMAVTSKNAANAGRAGWKERKKSLPPFDHGVSLTCFASTAGVAGRREGEAAGGRCVDKSEEEIERFAHLFGIETGTRGLREVVQTACDEEVEQAQDLEVPDENEAAHGLLDDGLGRNAEPQVPARGFWPDEMRNWHITHLEREAVYKTVQAFLKDLEIKKFNENGEAHVLYDDGDEETLDLSEENFKIIDSADLSELTAEAADVDSENIDRGGDYEENKHGGAVENYLTRSPCERWRERRTNHLVGHGDGGMVPQDGERRTDPLLGYVDGGMVSQRGGVAFIDSSGDVSISECHMTGNAATKDGGFAYIDSSGDVLISEGNITGNTAWVGAS